MSDDRNDERRRAQRRAVREYHRLGYEVLERPRSDALPAFLHGFAPDLVVMKDDDKAVVEIRTERKLLARNEFAKLAEAIERQTGWRLELISLGRRQQPARELPESELDRLLSAAWQTYDAGQRDLSLIYLVSVLNELVWDAAVRHRMRGRDRSSLSVIDQLVSEGVIDDATSDVLERAWARRNALVHGGDEVDSPGREEIARIVAACREMRAATLLEVA